MAPFRRAEPRRRVKASLHGLVSAVERTHGWQVAEHAGEATPTGRQRLLAGAHWDADTVRDDRRASSVERLGDAEAVLIVDETGFLTHGTKSVSVARQDRGTAGERAPAGWRLPRLCLPVRLRLWRPRPLRA